MGILPASFLLDSVWQL